MPASSAFLVSIAIAPNNALKALQTTKGVVELVLGETLTTLCNPNLIPSTAHEVSTLELSAIRRLRSFEEISASFPR